MEGRGGNMLLTALVTLALAGIYSTAADPVQSVEKRIFCNMIGCTSKRSHESSSSMDAFDPDNLVVPHKKDMSAENLLSRGEMSPSSIRQQIERAWLSNSPEEIRRLPSARGYHGLPSFDNDNNNNNNNNNNNYNNNNNHNNNNIDNRDFGGSFWRELQARMLPRYQHRVRRDAVQMLKKMRTRTQTQEV